MSSYDLKELLSCTKQVLDNYIESKIPHRGDIGGSVHYPKGAEPKQIAMAFFFGNKFCSRTIPLNSIVNPNQRPSDVLLDNLDELWKGFTMLFPELNEEAAPNVRHIDLSKYSKEEPPENIS